MNPITVPVPGMPAEWVAFDRLDAAGVGSFTWGLLLGSVSTVQGEIAAAVAVALGALVVARAIWRFVK